MYGLFSPGSPAGFRARTLSAAVSTLTSILGVPTALVAAADGVVEVPSPGGLDLARDDRIGVPARALLVQGARRSFGDLGPDARAVALALAHHAAWKRFHESGQPLGLILVDPESLLPPAPSAGAPEARRQAALRAALTRASAWDLLLLGALVPPQLQSAARGAAAAEAALEHAGWVTAQRWRGWHAYMLTRAGAATLLEEGALPLAQRAEAHASCLVELGLLRALALRSEVEGGGGAAAAATAASPASSAPEAPLIARPLGWGAAEGSGDASLGSLLAEWPCDLCELPEDYSRLGHILIAAGPSAVIAGGFTFFLLQVMGCKNPIVV